MLNETRKLIQQDSELKLLLFGGLIIQLITCVVQVGFFHPDQHFQIIEFSSYQLHKASGATHVWELSDFIRPTLQIYFFSAYRIICEFIKISNPYFQLTLLRIIFGTVLFSVFNIAVIYYFKNEKRKTLYYTLLILNFSWILPYTRTLFTSEMMSSLFFFGALFYYDCRKDRIKDFTTPFITGFLFCLSFYFRFQVGFAIIGFGVWMLLFKKKYWKLLPLVAGFFIAFLINTYLDYRFYHQLVFTPYHYFHVNINEGKAASFGTSSFIVYIGLLIAVITAPFLSIMLIYYGLKASLKKYNDPIFITVLFFIVAHCYIGHKEERFLFPVLNVLPIIVGWGIPGLVNYYQTCKKWVVYSIKGILIFSICLNIILLAFFTFMPYSQTVYFSGLLKNEFNNKPVSIYCLSRTPFETESGLPLTFYKNGVNTIELKKITYNDSVRNLTGNEIFIATTFNQIKKDKPMFDSLGYKPLIYSSKLLWNINEYLQSKKINTINDIWVLYKKQ